MSEPIPAYATSIGVRAAAEAASAIRRSPEDAPKPIFLATRWDPEKADWVTEEQDGGDPCSAPGVLVSPVDTLYVQPDRRAVAEISIRPEDGKAVDLMRYDAVFWTESAVEKFVLSYYASKYQWAAAFYLSALTQVFYGYVPDVLPSNRPRPGEAAARTLVHVSADGTTTEHEAIPFAMGHLPRSDYAPIDADGGTAGLAHDLWFLFLEAEGDGVVHRPLADFLPALTEAPR